MRVLINISGFKPTNIDNIYFAIELKKKFGKKKLIFRGYFFSRGIKYPPKTINIANRIPAIGTPVCCMAIVFVDVPSVLLVFDVGITVALFNLRVSEDNEEPNIYCPAFTVFPVIYR